MPNIFGKLWRSFLGTPELAAPPDFSERSGRETSRAIDESGLRELIDSLQDALSLEPNYNDLDQPHTNPASDEDSFIYFGMWRLTPWSSNVIGFLYRYNDQQLTVAYKGRRSPSEAGFYIYYAVEEALGRRFYRCASPGGREGTDGGVWNDLRERGTVCGHYREYVFLPGPSSWHPKNPCT